MENEGYINKIEKIKMPIRIVIFVATVAVLAGLFIYLVYLPKTEGISSTSKDIVKLKSKLNRVKIRAKDLPKLEAQNIKVNTQFKEALKILPNSREIPKLLITITRLGKESGLEYRTFTPLKERKRDFFIEIPVKVQLGGKYHDVAMFFDKISRMDRIVNIINVSMKPAKNLSTALKTNCTAVTYRFKEKAKKKSSKRKKRGKKR